MLAALWAALLFGAFGCKRYADVNAMPAAPAPEASGPTPGQFLDADKLVLGEAWVGSRAASAAYVLIGEGHPMACDHQAQAQVLDLMADAGAPPVVGLEMVSLDMQPVLDLFNKGIIGVDDLDTALKWSQNWGYPFELYRPIFEVARKRNLPLFALNVPRDAARKAGKVGLKGLPKAERLDLPAKIIPPLKEQEQYLRQVFDAHPFGTPKDADAAWKSFVTVQSLWDTTMARRAVEARVAMRRPVAIIAGGGHVERGWGIASRLSIFDPQGARLLIMPWRGGEAPDKAEADLFFYCPEEGAGRPRLGLALEVKDSTVTVVAVVPGSRAEAAGFKPGDVLAKAQGGEVRSLADLHDATMSALRQGGTLRLEILREGRPEELTVTLPAIKPGP